MGYGLRVTDHVIWFKGLWVREYGSLRAMGYGLLVMSGGRVPYEGSVPFLGPQGVLSCSDLDSAASRNEPAGTYVHDAFSQRSDVSQSD